MSTSDEQHRHDHEHGHEQQRRITTAVSNRAIVERAEPVENSGTPEAVRAAEVARRGQVGPGGLAAADQTKGRGVEWVRVSDLIARQTSPLAGRGISFQAELARRARTPVAAGARRVADRARRLPPVSAFGRRSPGHGGPTRSGVGMS